MVFFKDNHEIQVLERDMGKSRALILVQAHLDTCLVRPYTSPRPLILLFSQLSHRIDSNISIVLQDAKHFPRRIVSQEHKNTL